MATAAISASRPMFAAEEVLPESVSWPGLRLEPVDEASPGAPPPGPAAVVPSLPEAPPEAPPSPPLRPGAAAPFAPLPVVATPGTFDAEPKLFSDR